MKRTGITSAIVGLLVGTLTGLCAAETALAKSAPRRRVQVEGVVNINEAPVAKLVLLPYVGKAKARAIVRYRNKRRFERASDLVRVPGIGKSTFLKIKSHVTVSGPTTIRRKAAPRRRKTSTRRRKSGRQRRASKSRR